MTRFNFILALCVSFSLIGCSDGNPSDPRIPALQRVFATKFITGSTKAKLKRLSLRREKLRWNYYGDNYGGYDPRVAETPTYKACEAAIELACRYVQRGEFNKALAVLEQDYAMAISTTVYRAILYEQLGDHDRATQTLKDAFADWGGMPPKEVMRNIGVCLALIECSKGQFEEAETTLHKTESRYDDFTDENGIVKQIRGWIQQKEVYHAPDTLLLEFFCPKS